ncbi:hypothetical protein ACWC2K_24615 [Streptomyces chattanoogensis]
MAPSPRPTTRAALLRPFLLAWVATTALAGTALRHALKAAIGRARPAWTVPVNSAHSAAYPSGHAISVLAAGGLALWLLRLCAAPPHR